jgi:cysteine synthase A
MPFLPDITAAIGATKLVRLPNLSRETGVELLAKVESSNPGGSVKDRIARAMVDDAEARGVLARGATLIEPTSGNTGIALAMIAAARGYRLILTMPEAMSSERVALLRAFGAEVILTPGALMKASVEQAEALAHTMPGAVMLRQFENPANPRIHAETTAEEIWRDVDAQVDLFVAGIGTGGTITGVGRVLKQRRPSVRVVGVEPAAAAVLTGGPLGHHGIQGIGAGFVPKNLDLSVVDEVIAVDDATAIMGSRRLVETEGLLAGISSGAVLSAALALFERESWRGRRAVAMLPDGGERYLSTALFRR